MNRIARKARTVAGVTVMATVFAGAGNDDVVKPLNEALLRMARSYPADGTHRYWWPRGSTWEGTTRDLWWGRDRIARGDPRGRCYCSGITFEAYVRTLQADPDLEAAARRRIPDAESMRRFRLLWYGAKDQRDTARRALTEFGLGVAVESLEEALPGDILQIWRKDGSGHCVILLDVVRDDAGRISGVKYWSSQPTTRGIGERVEMFEPDGPVRRDELYIARALAP